MAKFYDGSGKIEPQEQAVEAYREMRRSLVKYAEAEAELHERVTVNGERLTSIQEQLIVGRLHAWRDRAMMFAAVYHVEMDRSDRKFRSVGVRQRS